MSEKQGEEGRTLREVVILPNGVNAQPEEVKEDGTNAPLAKRVAESRLHEIAKRIEDPNFSQVDLMKLIASEMTAILISQNAILDFISQKDTTSYNKVNTKEVIMSLNEQLKGVELLGRQITNMDNLAKRDYINFDGDKFRWIAEQWMKLGAEAVRSMGLGETQVHSWKGHFRKHLESNEDRIRREADKQVWLEEQKAKKAETGS
jgi:hypothetical protein